MVPAGGKHLAGLNVEQKKRNVVTGKIALQRLAGGLSKQRSSGNVGTAISSIRRRTLCAHAGGNER